MKRSKDFSLCEFLVENQEGMLSSLSKYDDKDVNHFCKLGFLTRGIDSDDNQRYRVTSLGQSQLRLLCAQEQMEGALDTLISILQ